MRLHFREYGRGAPVIILHGLFGSLDNWAYISQQLADSFQVFALDQRNHGLSPHSDDMSYEAMAADVKEFMEEHSISRAHLIGHSMGGKAAIRFALTHPEKVDGLAIVDMAPRPYGPAHDHIFEALLALDLKSFQARTEIEEALATTIPDLAVRRFVLKSLTRDEAGAFRWKFNLPGLHRTYPTLNETLSSNGAVDTCALFIRGGNSDYIRNEDLPEIRRLFPRAQVVTIPNADHWVHAEAPEEFLQVVRKHLSRKD